MSNEDYEILSKALIQFLGNVTTYQKVLLNQQERLKKIELSHLGLLKKLLNEMSDSKQVREDPESYKRSDTMEFLNEAFGETINEFSGKLAKDKTSLLPSARKHSLTLTCDTNVLDNIEQEMQTRPEKRCKTKPHFRFRVREMFEAGTWSEDGLCITMASKMVRDLNADLQRPLVSMRKRMAKHKFVIRSSEGMWKIQHPNLNALNWEMELFNF